MKKIFIAFFICIVFCISMSGQVRDTLKYGSYRIILNIEGFSNPIVQWDDECGELSRQYVYLREYEQLKKYPASILICMLPPVSEFNYHTYVDSRLYCENDNRYGGVTKKYCSDDGLYFRYDTYGGYFSRIKVMYYFVREEDLDFFDSILDNVEIQPIE